MVSMVNFVLCCLLIILILIIDVTNDGGHTKVVSVEGLFQY
jgi:hypothetical protein